jgi:hypothetical protein
MDGCSMGTESHFASTLIAKLLRKIAKMISFRDFAEGAEKTTPEYLKAVLSLLFQELKDSKSRLMLDTDEMLSTLILGILDHQRKEAELIAIGDGVICNSDSYLEFDQDNRPDYLGYHLDEDFADWYRGQTQKLSLRQVSDLSICTDGIFTFRCFNPKVNTIFGDEQLIDFLLIDRRWEEQENMLQRKLIEMEKKYGLQPFDDLTIIRIIMDPGI